MTTELTSDWVLTGPSRIIPKLTENAQAVLARRYLVKNDQGQVCESAADLFARVALHIASADLAFGVSKQAVLDLAEAFYDLMASLAFLPNSPTLINAGRPLGQLSACFVLPIDDSMISIFETLKHTALIHQSGGGTGFSFSKLRPAGDVVRSTMGVSSGPVSFMEVYNAATEAIKQGGTRRGANMGVLSIDHPDIEAFINAKADLRKVTNFNISVTITDAFMEAVAADDDFALRHPKTGEITHTVKARRLFDQIVDSAWQTGEPGMVFIDEINRHNPTPAQGRIESTNPCGEVPLLPYEACNLGSINLSQMLTAEKTLDWDKLAETTRLAVHFLDNVISRNVFPIPELKAMAEGNRKIGLGVMGWADCLIALGIPYDTDEAVQLGREVMAWIDYHSKLASVALAETRGSFPNFTSSRYASENWLSESNSGRHIQHITSKITQKSWQYLDEQIHLHGLRNATTTCVAPTGSISIIAGSSGGIEPVFAPVFTRNIMDNTRLAEAHPAFNEKTSQKRVLVTSFDITPDWHVKMQAAFQEFTDNGVSKTINFPESATREEVATAFRMAYQLGIKGMTVYRNNSRLDQPMTLEADASKQPPPPIACVECD